jgi:hypothetical protein
MSMPGFTAAQSLPVAIRPAGPVRRTAASRTDVVVPQGDRPPPGGCYGEQVYTSCYGIVQMCQRYCMAADGLHAIGDSHQCGWCVGFWW